MMTMRARNLGQLRVECEHQEGGMKILNEYIIQKIVFHWSEI